MDRLRCRCATSILMIAFKIYISKTAELRFRYYEPTPAEAEAGAARPARSAPSTRICRSVSCTRLCSTTSCPGHGAQEPGITRERSAQRVPLVRRQARRKSDGVLIKAVREEISNNDPERDGPRDEAHQAEWDARRSLRQHPWRCEVRAWRFGTRLSRTVCSWRRRV